MSWFVIALIWIAVSFTVAGLIGRFIHFGMTGKLNAPVKRAEEGHGGIVALSK